MICPKCGNEMIISEWDGWIWLCVFCDREGPISTSEEWDAWEAQQKSAWEQVLIGKR